MKRTSNLGVKGKARKQPKISKTTMSGKAGGKKY